MSTPLSLERGCIYKSTGSFGTTTGLFFLDEKNCLWFFEQSSKDWQEVGKDVRDYYYGKEGVQRLNWTETWDDKAHLISVDVWKEPIDRFTFLVLTGTQYKIPKMIGVHNG